MLQRQELRKAGLKVTLPRLKILEILETSRQRHLSAEDIYKELLQDIRFSKWTKASITITWCALRLVRLSSS
jgi:Fe2+ or Zn2+ uptake regulation protein